MCGGIWCELSLTVCSGQTGMSGSTGQCTGRHAVHRHSSTEEVQPDGFVQPADVGRCQHGCVLLYGRGRCVMLDRVEMPKTFSFYASSTGFLLVSIRATVTVCNTGTKAWPSCVAALWGGWPHPIWLSVNGWRCTETALVVSQHVYQIKSNLFIIIVQVQQN